MMKLEHEIYWDSLWRYRWRFPRTSDHPAAAEHPWRCHAGKFKGPLVLLVKERLRKLWKLGVPGVLLVKGKNGKEQSRHVYGPGRKP